MKRCDHRLAAALVARRRAGGRRRAARSRRAHGHGGDRERLHAAQLRRPEDRRGHRLGIRRLQRDRQAPQPQGRVEAVELGHHDPGRPRGPVRRRHGRHHHHRRAQGAGRFLRPLHGLAAVHAGPRRREPLHRRQEPSPPTRTCSSAPRPARPTSTPPSTTCSTATRPIRASSCSTPSAPRSRR